MAEYKNCEALCEYFQEKFEYYKAESEKQVCGGYVFDEKMQFAAIVAKHFLDKVKEAPAADVVEVVHAYWDKDCVTGIMCCSNCRMPPPGDAELQDFYESPYCQSCGAKMDANSKPTLPETTRQTVLNSFMKGSEV